MYKLGYLDIWSILFLNGTLKLSMARVGSSSMHCSSRDDVLGYYRMLLLTFYSAHKTLHKEYNTAVFNTAVLTSYIILHRGSASENI